MDEQPTYDGVSRPPWDPVASDADGAARFIPVATELTRPAAARLEELIILLNPLGNAIARRRPMARTSQATGPSSSFQRTQGSGLASRPRHHRSRRHKGRDARLPRPGSMLRRWYKGREVTARALDQGFEFEGRRYRSLSAIARAVTGAHWNGLLFFGLVTQEK